MCIDSITGSGLTVLQFNNNISYTLIEFTVAQFTWQIVGLCKHLIYLSIHVIVSIIKILINVDI